MPLLRSLRPLLLLPVLAFAVGCDYSVNGEVGPPGPPGFDGRDAEVRSFTFAFEGRDLFVDQGGFNARAIVEVDQLDEDIVEFGVVLAYVDGAALREEDGEITWVALPLTFGETDENGELDYTITYTYSYEIDRFTLELFASAPLNWEEQGRLNVRVVLIPGKDLLDPATDTSDYAAVARALDLDAVPATRVHARAAR